MARIEIGKNLAVDTRVCGGRLSFKGTRVTVSDALELFETGYTSEAVAKQYRVLVIRARSSLIYDIAQSRYLRGFCEYRN